MAAVALGMIAAAGPAGADDAAPRHGESAAPRPAPRINEAQVIGTHNSYHLAPDEAMRTLISQRGRETAEGLDYSHRPLAEQFGRLGIRQVELDLFADPEGGLYRNPKGPALAAAFGLASAPIDDPDGELARPGTKVLHAPDFDFRTTVRTLESALAEMRDWSRENSGHFPILVLLELKEDALGPGLTQPVPFDEPRLRALEGDIGRILGRESILAPDDVRGDAPTLREAIEQRGWPAIDAARGRFILALDNEDAIRDRYIGDRPSLEGRLLFVSVPESHPASAFLKINDPVRGFDRIRKAVEAGRIVRTRADADTREARADDGSRRDKAFASGAQFVSTDYPEPDERFSGYAVRLPGGVTVRTNPVIGDRSRDGIDLEATE